MTITVNFLLLSILNCQCAVDVQLIKTQRKVHYKYLKGNVSAPENSMISVADAFALAAEIASKSWQCFWDCEISGQHT